MLVNRPLSSSQAETQGACWEKKPKDMKHGQETLD